MIRIISGKTGKGKTLLAVYFMFLDTIINGHENYKKTCEAIEELNNSGFKYRYPISKHTTYFNGNVVFTPFGSEKKTPYNFSPWLLGLPSQEHDTHLFFPYGKIYIDEAQVYFNSRMSSSFPAYVSRFFELHRQFDLDITLIAQRAGLIDINIRELAEELFYVEESEREEDILGNLVHVTWKIRRFTDNADLEHYIAGKKELGEEITIECTENLYKYYDTKFFKFLFLNQRKNQQFLQRQIKPFKYSPEICDKLSQVYQAYAPAGYYKKVASEGD